MNRPATANDLDTLLHRLDPQASLAQRHIWLIDMLAWIRGDASSPQAAVERVQQLFDAVEARPEVYERLRAWWRTFGRTVDLTALLAEHGVPVRGAFLGELNERWRRKILPGTPETTDASELMRLVMPKDSDAAWIQQLDIHLLKRIGKLTPTELIDGLPRWQHDILDAITFCASQVVATGFSAELRNGMDETGRESEPFHHLMPDLDALREEVVREPRNPEALQAAFVAFRDRLDGCRAAAMSVYTHLDENGVSVGLVFKLRQLRARLVRIRDLLDCLLSEQHQRTVAQLVARLVMAGGERNSIRQLISDNSSLLAAKLAERNAEVGEHYITRDRSEYRGMLLSAAGGGFITGFTVLLKFGWLALGLTAFWTGFGVGVLYALSFIVIQFTHATLATKQPAMTAPAMAAKLKDLESAGAIESFVDEVANLVRSQVAAVLGNVLLVAPTALLLYMLLDRVFGIQAIDEHHAHETLDSLGLFGTLVPMAAATGVVLFASSLIAGWAENYFVLHRLDSAIRYNPRITARLGAARAQRWASFLRTHISGLAANISLGMMMGLVPVFFDFFGVPLQTPHVTLSTGQIAVAAEALGAGILTSSLLWWSVASIPVLGLLNVGVSFYCAFRLALRAHNVSGVDRARIRAAIRARLRKRPMSFLLPR
ncbi:site-specific recombinase [Variovorax rhizosphaerae]|uniref:Site-specific recombinase n=1 Tax=Variovorax rhizosphaerae TaxID=1836200 RepID=A0ABU8WHN6_9BURK